MLKIVFSRCSPNQLTSISIAMPRGHVLHSAVGGQSLFPYHGVALPILDLENWLVLCPQYFTRLISYSSDLHHITEVYEMDNFFPMTKASCHLYRNLMHHITIDERSINSQIFFRFDITLYLNFTLKISTFICIFEGIFGFCMHST